MGSTHWAPQSSEGDGHRGEEPEGRATRGRMAAVPCPLCRHGWAMCPPSEIKAHYPGAIFGTH